MDSTAPFYKSIKDIQKDFAIETSDISEIKKHLKELLKEIHPDKNNGAFSSKLNELNYSKIISALDYLDQDFSLVPKGDLGVLTKIIQNSLLEKKEDTTVKVLQERSDRFVKSFHSTNIFPRVGSAVISGLLTLFWFFPSTILEHPVLSKFVDPTNLTFQMIWLGCVFCTLIFWLVTKTAEDRIATSINRLSLESTHELIFTTFIDSETYEFRSRKKGKKNENKKDVENVFRFTKSDLIKHITYLKIHTLDYDFLRTSVSFITNRLFRFNPNITLDLAQTLSDIIIDKALNKGLVIIEGSRNLSNVYVYKIKKGDENYNDE